VIEVRTHWQTVYRKARPHGWFKARSRPFGFLDIMSYASPPERFQLRPSQWIPNTTLYQPRQTNAKDLIWASTQQKAKHLMAAYPETRLCLFHHYPACECVLARERATLSINEFGINFIIGPKEYNFYFNSNPCQFHWPSSICTFRPTRAWFIILTH